MKNDCTIFIPVYNEAERIEIAIRSAAPQCARLLISDNASTDSTFAICSRLKAEFGNIELYKQESNIGAMNNWLFLLEKVDTPYCMALGSHDSISSNYIEKLQGVLETEPDTDLAVGALYFQTRHRTFRDIAFSNWDGGYQPNKCSRLHSVIFSRAPLGWTAYGLFRTDKVKKIMLREPNAPYGIDFILLARTAAQGKIKVEGNAAYYAWFDESAKRSTSYTERLLGTNKSRAYAQKMRNQFRAQLFEIYANECGITTAAQTLSARFHFMTRIGLFHNNTIDAYFYSLYLPVKITRQLRRAFKKKKDSVGQQ